jgi:hypothetical protein
MKCAGQQDQFIITGKINKISDSADPKSPMKAILPAPSYHAAGERLFSSFFFIYFWYSFSGDVSYQIDVNENINGAGK